MSTGDLGIEFDYSSSDDGLLGDDTLVEQTESQPLASPASKPATLGNTCPVCKGILESDYQEHIQGCVVSSSLPQSPSSPSSTSRLRDSISKYQTQFQGLGIYQRLQMMESLQRLARRCTSELSPISSPISPFSPERKASPIQEVDNKVLTMLFTQKNRKRRAETKLRNLSTRQRVESPVSVSSVSSVSPISSPISPPVCDPIIPVTQTTLSAPTTTLSSNRPAPLDPSSFLTSEKDTPAPEEPSPSVAAKNINIPREAGFGLSSLSPLDSPSSFDFSLSPPKEGCGTTFFLTPSQSVATQSSAPTQRGAFGSEIQRMRQVQAQTPAPIYGSTGFDSLQGHDSKSHEEVLKLLISQYQILLARTEAFLRTIPIDSKSGDMGAFSAPPPVDSSDPTQTIQQLATLSSKRLQQSFAQVAALQEKISQCAQSSMFQTPNSFSEKPFSLPSGFSSILASFMKKSGFSRPPWEIPQGSMFGSQ